MKLKHLIATLAMVMLVTTCGLAQDDKAQDGKAEDTHVAPPVPFGKKGDQSVELFTLTNKAGMTVKISTLGATLVELHVPDKNGKAEDVILGFDNAAGYQSEDNQYFGCTTGRVCNRIAKGKFTLNGKEYTLATNNETNHLHGGKEKSLDKVVWKGSAFKPKFGYAGVRFRYVSPDGEEGYPGRLNVTVSFVIMEKKNILRIQYFARTNKPTPVFVDDRVTSTSDTGNNADSR